MFPKAYTQCLVEEKSCGLEDVHRECIILSLAYYTLRTSAVIIIHYGMFKAVGACEKPLDPLSNGYSFVNNKTLSDGVTRFFYLHFI